MNEKIEGLARRSGATDENGSRATTTFCFTKQELNGFTELIIQECIYAIPLDMDSTEYLKVVRSIKNHFGVQ